MTAEEAYKLAEEARKKGRDIRLEKFIEWIERDITSAAKLGKYKLLIDYMNRPITDETILKIQDALLQKGFQIITKDEPELFRTFTIEWDKELDE